MSAVASASIAIAALASLAAGCSQVAEQPGGSVTLEWTPPAPSADDAAVAGYAVYYWRTNEGRVQRIDVPDPRRHALTVERLPPGEYRFAMASYDARGTHSELSQTFRHIVE